MLNKRGYAITGIMYVILLLFLVTIFGMFVVLGSRKVILDNYKSKIQEKIDQGPSTDDYVKENLVLWYDVKLNKELISQLIINNDQLYDLSNNSNTGSLIDFNLATCWGDDYLIFDGVNDYVNTGMNANSFSLDDDFSLEIFFQIDQVEALQVNKANTSVLLGAFNGEGFGIVWETYDEDDTKYYLRAGARVGINESFSNNYEVSDFSNKQHVIMTYSKLYNEINFYVNGILVSTVAGLAGEFTDVLGNVMIGLNQVYDSGFLGSYSDMNLLSVKIYERALSANEVVRNYTVDQARYKYEWNVYVLTIETVGEGTTNPSEGFHFYNYGQNVNIFQNAEVGYAFTGWSGDCSGTDSCSVSMTQNRSVGATFAINQYTVTYDGNGGTCDPTSRTVNYNTTSAAPSCTRSGYNLTGFTRTSGSGGTLDTETGAVTNVTGNQTIRADWAVAHVCGQNFTDSRDSKVYATVQIGTQCWFAENLRHTGNGCLSNSWTDTSPFDACRTNDGTDWDKDKVLYQWGAAMNGDGEGGQGLCPTGWYVPTHNDFTDLERFVCNDAGNSNCDTTFPKNTTTSGWRGTNEGEKLKSTSPSWEGTNTVGFNAKPAGNRFPTGPLVNVGDSGYLWTSTPSTANAWTRYLDIWFMTVNRDARSQAGGFSVRCLLGT